MPNERREQLIVKLCSQFNETIKKVCSEAVLGGIQIGQSDERIDMVAWLRTEVGRLQLNKPQTADLYRDIAYRITNLEHKPR